MNPDLAFFLILVVLGWLALLVHLVNLVLAVRSDRLSLWVRALALVPVATPVVAWLGGRRLAPILWVVALASYLVVRGAKD